MRFVLSPYWIAKECFLKEALMWAGFYRYPKSEIIPDEVDFRFHKDSQDEYEPNIPDDWGYIESGEAIRVGLPTNPAWEALFDNEETYMLSDPETIETFLKMDIDETEKKKLRKDLVRSKKQAALQAEWDKGYAEYIELIEAKLFIALKEGKLKAFGKRIFEEDGFNNWKDEHEEIPPKFWRREAIDWTSSASKTDTGHYCHICVQTEQLFALFPEPEADKARAVSIIAGQYILDEDTAPKNLKMGKRGRPALDWGSFYLELAERVKRGDLPAKQEAFVAEMQKWCLENWGQEPGRSTILQKISPFYKKYVKK
jgi:hypothetical protein